MVPFFPGPYFLMKLLPRHQDNVKINPNDQIMKLDSHVTNKSTKCTEHILHKPYGSQENSIQPYKMMTTHVPQYCHFNFENAGLA